MQGFLGKDRENKKNVNVQIKAGKLACSVFQKGVRVWLFVLGSYSVRSM